MDKMDLVIKAGAAHAAGIRALTELAWDSPEQQAAEAEAEDTWQAARAAGATPDEIRAAAGIY